MSIVNLNSDVLLLIFGHAARPLILRNVNRCWRAIIDTNSGPWLVHNFVIPIYYSTDWEGDRWVVTDQPGLDDTVNEIQRWSSLQRGRTTSLVVNVSEGGSYEEIAPDQLASIALYFSKSHSISINCLSGLWDLLNHASTDQPHLEYLVSWAGHISPAPTPNPTQSLDACGFNSLFPRLRRLSLGPRWVSGSWFTQSSPIFWDTHIISPNLTHIALHHLSLNADSWYSFIRALPNLEWAHFDLIRCTLPVGQVRPPEVVFNSLKHLHINIESFSEDLYCSFSTLLKGLNFPALEVLFLHSGSSSWYGQYLVRTVGDVVTVTVQAPTLKTLVISTDADIWEDLDPLDLPPINKIVDHILLQVVNLPMRLPFPTHIKEARRIGSNLRAIMRKYWSTAEIDIELLFHHENADELGLGFVLDPDVHFVKSVADRNCAEWEEILS